MAVIFLSKSLLKSCIALVWKLIQKLKKYFGSESRYAIT